MLSGARGILAGAPFYGWRLFAAAIIVVALSGAEPVAQPGESVLPWWLSPLPLSSLLMPVAGWLISRRFGARRAMLLGLPLAGVGLTAAGLWGGATGYLVTLPLVAIGTTLGGWLPAVTVINAQFRRRPATALALLILGATLVGSLPALAGGPRELLIASGILTLVVAFPLARRMPDPPDADADDGEGNGDEHPGQTARNAAAGPMPAYAPEYTLRAALRSRDFWLLLAGGGCIQAAITAGLFTLVYLHLPAGPGATLPLSIAYLAATTGALSTLAIPAGGLLGDRMPLRRALTLLALLVLAGLAGMAVAGNGVVLALAIILVNIGSGGIGPPDIAALGVYFGRRNFALLLGISMLFHEVIARSAAAIIVELAELQPYLMLNAGVVAGMAGALAYNAMGHPQPPPAPGGSGRVDGGRRAASRPVDAAAAGAIWLRHPQLSGTTGNERLPGP